MDWTHHLIRGQVPEDFVVTLFDSTLDRQIDVSDPRTEVVIAMRVKDRDSICEKLTTTKLPGLESPPLPIHVEPPYDVPGSGGRVRVNFTAHSVAREGEFEASIYIAIPGDVPALNTTLSIRVVERSKVPAFGFRKHVRI